MYSYQIKIFIPVLFTIISLWIKVFHNNNNKPVIYEKRINIIFLERFEEILRNLQRYEEILRNLFHYIKLNSSYFVKLSK